MQVCTGHLELGCDHKMSMWRVVVLATEWEAHMATAFFFPGFCDLLRLGESWQLY